MDLDELAPSLVAETPAAYLHLVDNRSDNLSQRIFPIWDREVFKIGRDPRSNTLTIDNDPAFMVSRNHCEFYVVVYEPTINHVYVRDRKSVNGTFVNGNLIGSEPKLSAGYLLQDGDIVEIRPHWKFVFAQDHSPPSYDLTDVQKRECKMFSDKYQLTNRCLGHGAEAIVYLAVDASTKRQLVCKMVNLKKVRQKAGYGTVYSKLQETDILRQLRHPNILPYIDAVISPHTLYTFTELASGGDLMSFIYRHAVVKEFDSRIIVRQIIRGLKYLHEKGIVHRDLKPENILLAYSPRLAYHRIMLSDFGYSAVPRRNRMLTNVGTSCYQAPEINSGAALPHTEAVDIWSMGVVTFLLLTAGSDPKFEGMNRMSQDEIKNFLKGNFSNLDHKVSGCAKDFIWRCLQTIPSKRMSAPVADCHEWLWTPEKHLLFFRELDRRMLADWDHERELIPMPFELPDVVRASPPVAESNADSRFSQYFASRSEDTLRTLKSTPKASLHDTKPGDLAENSAREEHAHISPDLGTRPIITQIDKQSSQEIPEKLTNKLSQPPWEGFSKPNAAFVKPSPPSKRKRSSRNRVNEGALLPLTNLQRHLNPPPGNSKRERVLEELKKSRAKFLIEHNLAIPETPPKVESLEKTPLTPKGQKKRDALKRSSGGDPLGVPQIKFR